ncbi:hypothetical protein BU16DRAFT_619488 [Lophium mytilinum]|uniref:Uncharacterized protein n=1 Tax=Lophium mytilinum TaxID=390894 RepID=A0A6A6QLG9_9PEZI|nr:hypothetical protein BU16DRAFT_619488 [Lophium mytilinum]
MYKHTLIRERKMRVLRLLPSPIKTISYIWDGQMPGREIDCQGEKLMITENAETTPSASINNPSKTATTRAIGEMMMIELGEETLSNTLSMLLSMYYYVIFRSKKGSYGFAQANAQAGDAIALAPRVDTPIVLRPHGERYKYIGKVFLPRIMEGEAWPKDESALHDITIE